MLTVCATHAIGAEGAVEAAEAAVGRGAGGKLQALLRFEETREQDASFLQRGICYFDR